MPLLFCPRSLCCAGFTVTGDRLYSNPLPEHSLTIHSAASSQKTHGIMLTIALMGIPVVVAYTICIYWIFRGKVKLTPMSY